MEISKHILDEAKEILQKGDSLPAQITSAPSFYVAEKDDDTVHAFGAVRHDGATYKVGTKVLVPQ